MRYRASSLCIIKRDESILLERFPEFNGVTTFRPVGGTIEYGEESQAAVVREVKEEINEDIVDPQLIGIVENIFPWFDEIGHEYDFIYEAKFAHPDAYDKEVIHGIEGDKEYVAVWMNLDDFQGNLNFKLVPDGLYDMLRPEKNSEAVRSIRHVSTKALDLRKPYRQEC